MWKTIIPLLTKLIGLWKWLTGKEKLEVEISREKRELEEDLRRLEYEYHDAKTLRTAARISRNDDLFNARNRKCLELRAEVNRIRKRLEKN